MSVLSFAIGCGRAFGRYVPGGLVVGALYAVVVIGGVAGFLPALSEGTTYGFGYGLWFGALVVAGLAIVLGPFLGARVGGLDWDLGTVKDVHLAGQSVLGSQLRALGGTTVVACALTLVGVVASAVTAALSMIGENSWLGDARFVSTLAIGRLLLGAIVGLPFVLTVGWAAAVLLRSSYKGVLLVEGTLVLYIVSVRWVYESGSAAAIYRYSPWGSVMAMLVGGYRPPRLVVEPVLGPLHSTLLVVAWIAVAILAVSLSARLRNVGGGDRSP